jgi:polyphosphate kinase
MQKIEKPGKKKARAHPGELSKKVYDKTLRSLQIELVKMQEWVVATGAKIVVIFEGRDAAGKGGAIKRIIEPLNPRVCRIVALPKPTETERHQWYFQRYVAHLPTAGEIVLFDRSWYNRAGVERVMGFCTPAETADFLTACPEFERMLVQSGIRLIKYWFSVSPEEQERRFQERAHNPLKTWKLSPVDIESRARWHDYSKAKDAMMEATDIPQAPWFVVDADIKERARLNCIQHLLSQVPYKAVRKGPIVLPTLPQPSQKKSPRRPPKEAQRFVPDFFGQLQAARA